MSFSKKQQGYYRPMVASAWERHCQMNGIRPAPPFADDDERCRTWYEDELENATGKRTSKDCDMKRDFEEAMAHFESIVGEGTYWFERLYGADARRIAHNIRELCQEFDVDEDYMRRIARRAAGLGFEDPLPELHLFTYDQLRTIMGELKRFLRRGGRPHVRQWFQAPRGNFHPGGIRGGIAKPKQEHMPF
jgi:hypothetical protein